MPLRRVITDGFITSKRVLQQRHSCRNVSFRTGAILISQRITSSLSTTVQTVGSFSQTGRGTIGTVDGRIGTRTGTLGRSKTVNRIKTQDAGFASLVRGYVRRKLLTRGTSTAMRRTVSTLREKRGPIVAITGAVNDFVRTCTRSRSLDPKSSVDLSFKSLLRQCLRQSESIIIASCRNRSAQLQLDSRRLNNSTILTCRRTLSYVHRSSFDNVPVDPVSCVRRRLRQFNCQIARIAKQATNVRCKTSNTVTCGIQLKRRAATGNEVSTITQFGTKSTSIVLLGYSKSANVSLRTSRGFTSRQPHRVVITRTRQSVGIFVRVLNQIRHAKRITLPGCALLVKSLPTRGQPKTVLYHGVTDLGTGAATTQRASVSLGAIISFVGPCNRRIIARLLTSSPRLGTGLSFPTTGTRGSTSSVTLVGEIANQVPLLPVTRRRTICDLVRSRCYSLISRTETVKRGVLRTSRLSLSTEPLTQVRIVTSSDRVTDRFAKPICLRLIRTGDRDGPLARVRTVGIIQRSIRLPRISTMSTRSSSTLTIQTERRITTAVARLRARAGRCQRTTITRGRSDGTVRGLGSHVRRRLARISNILRAFIPNAPLQLIAPTDGAVLCNMITKTSTGGQSKDPTTPGH